jgi:transposase-like protein
MTYENGFVRKNYYSIELQHKICKEHVEEGIRLADLVRKYDLSNHSLIHDWLRKLGYLPRSGRKTRSAYIGVENFQDLKHASKKSRTKTPEEQEIELLKEQLVDAKILAEGYRRMIEIAELELKLPIRKKLNTK